MRSSAIVTAVVSLLTINTNALKLDLDSSQSIKDAAKTIVSHILSIYDGPSSSGIPGLFPDNYFWWGSGLAFDSLINYAMVTGDDAYNEIISKGLLWQVGPNNDFMPQNQSASIGNDGQSIWALAAMTAAEQGFPDPPANSGVDSWLQLAKNVFDSQVLRWDNKTCDGGLRWQIYSFNTGYQYKNTLSNGDFMQLAARLARYTGNSTYSDWAARVSSWSLDIGFIDTSFAVYDGATTNGECKKIDKIEWTSNLGTYLSGYLYMYNMSKKRQWAYDASSLLLHANEHFASTPNSPKDGILTEVACAGQNSCNTGQLAFRAVLARALGNAQILASGQNFTSVTFNLTTVLRKSAAGAAAQCSGGANSTTCGSNWASSKWDGTSGLGQDLSALEIILANMPSKAKDVRTENGTSIVGGPATTTSGGASATSTNGAADRAVSSVVLLVAFGFAFAASV